MTRVSDRVGRVLALVLPELPLEVVVRLTGHRGAGPYALFERTAGGSLVIAAANAVARAAGVKPGITYAHALALVAGLVAKERRPEAEAEALLGAARWAAHALSPRVGTAPDERALLVDATGIGHVHGTEAALVAKAVGGLRALGHLARAAVADTPLAALAVAAFGSGTAVVAPGGAREALAGLPPRSLGLEPKALDALAAVGIETIGQLLALPRATLPVRFGEGTLLRLDRALGLRPDPITPAPLPEGFRERLELEGGSDRPEVLALALEELAERVLERLAAEGRAILVLGLVFERERRSLDAGPGGANGAGPGPEPLRLARPVSRLGVLLPILRERLERTDLGEPVTAVELRVVETARLAARQGDLFTPLEDDRGEDLASLLARLEGRLGVRRVALPTIVEDHRPERAFAWRSARAKREGGPAGLPAGRRPTRLLTPPERTSVALGPEGVPARFLWCGDDRAVASAVGPERIETGFWEGREVRRDYWILSDDAGLTTWLYRNLDTDEWFVHGIFD